MFCFARSHRPGLPRCSDTCAGAAHAGNVWQRGVVQPVVQPLLQSVHPSLPALPAPPAAHLLFSTVSFSFKLWKYCRIALACCRWYSMVTPLQRTAWGPQSGGGTSARCAAARQRMRCRAGCPAETTASQTQHHPARTWRLLRGLLLLRGHGPPRAPLLLLPAPKRRAALRRAAPPASAAAGRWRPALPPPPAGASCAAGRKACGTQALRPRAEGRQGWQAQGACRRRQRWVAAAAHQPAGARTTPDAPLGWRSGRRGSLQRWGRQGRRDSVRTIRPRQNHQAAGPAPRHKQLTGAAECQAHGARGCKRCEGGQRRARECWSSPLGPGRWAGGVDGAMQQRGPAPGR